MPQTPSRRERASAVLLAALFVALCAWPYLDRLSRPSLYTDDLVRLAIVRNVPLGQALGLPFNEHVAPLFELVSRAAWLASGEHLGRSAASFTIASALPWPLVLILLARIVKRRTESTASALAAVAVAGLSWLHVEVVEWYSASSFAWALAGILLAFDAPGPLALLASAAAPAFSAVGLMAGPMGALGAILRGMTPGCPVSGRESRTDQADPPTSPAGIEPVVGCSPCSTIGAALAPVVGTTLYLLMAWSAGLGGALSHSAERNLALPAAASAIVRAPVGVLVPALVGAGGDVRGAFGALDAAGFAAALAVCLVWAARSPKARPLVLGGLTLIVGGYAMAYLARASGPGASTLLRVQRYHLLPQFGLAMLLAPLAARALGRFETRPARSWLLGVAVAAVLLALHAREMRHRALCYRFADQAQTLRTLERLEPAWKRAGLSREQVIAVLGEHETRPWCAVEGLNPWVVLGPLDRSGRVPNDQAVRVLAGTLSERDRRVLRRR